ncbi:MAG: CheY-like chemotaxis protein [Sulfitobacter sp.]|jgi:CheY-like chemotaxis protein
MTTRILHIDDDPVFCDLIQRILAMDPSFKVRSCYTAGDALALMGQNLPDLIICDIEMPNMGGLEFVSKLQEITGAAQLPVILLSARVRQLEQYDAFKDMPVLKMEKPIKPEEFLFTVRKALAENPTA